MRQDDGHREESPGGPHREHDSVEPLIIETDQQLADSFAGAVQVHQGAHFELMRKTQHYGPLFFHAGSQGRLVGEHLGPLDLGSGSTVEVGGLQNGPVEIAAGAVLKIAPGGRLAGSIRVTGLVENRGIRAGNTVLAGGEVHDIDGGVVEPPIITRSATPDA